MLQQLSHAAACYLPDERVGCAWYAGGWRAAMATLHARMEVAAEGLIKAFSPSRARPHLEVADLQTSADCY